MTKTTQNSRVFEYLSSGAEPTVGELRTRLKIANPTAVIANMREILLAKNSVYDIYSNTRSNSRGQQTIRYRLGLAYGATERLQPFVA